MTTITAANTIFTIGVASLFPTQQQIQGYSADDVTDGEAQEMGDTMMGVDGVLTGGYVNVPFVQTINLMADSPSNDLFDQWAAAENLIQDKYVAYRLSLARAQTAAREGLSHVLQADPCREETAPAAGLYHSLAAWRVAAGLRADRWLARPLT